LIGKVIALRKPLWSHLVREIIHDHMSRLMFEKLFAGKVEVEAEVMVVIVIVARDCGRRDETR